MQINSQLMSRRSDILTKNKKRVRERLVDRDELVRKTNAEIQTRVAEYEEVDVEIGKLRKERLESLVGWSKLKRAPRENSFTILSKDLKLELPRNLLYHGKIDSTFSRQCCRYFVSMSVSVE